MHKKLEIEFKKYANLIEKQIRIQIKIHKEKCLSHYCIFTNSSKVNLLSSSLKNVSALHNIHTNFLV